MGIAGSTLSTRPVSNTLFGKIIQVLKDKQPISVKSSHCSNIRTDYIGCYGRQRRDGPLFVLPEKLEHYSGVFHTLLIFEELA